MKHCDLGIGDVRSRLSPLARPFTFGSSSSSFVQPGSSGVFSVAASESEPEDSIWGDYAFDLSFLTSDDQRSGGLDDDSLSNLSRDADAASARLKEGSELFGQAAYASEKDQRINPETMRQENVESFLGISNFLESDLRPADSQPQVSLSIPVISSNQSNSVVNLEGGFATHFPSTSVLGHTGTTPAVNGVSVANVNSADGSAAGQPPYAKGKAAFFGKVLVNQSIGENDPSSFFSKTSELRIRCSIGSDNDKPDPCSTNAVGIPEKSSEPSDQEDSEVDSPCWKGTQSYNTVASGSKAMSSRRSSDDLNRSYGLNPLAPRFIPASAKKSLDKHVKECGEGSASSLKKSLSSTFPLSSEDYSLTDIPKKAVIQKNSGKTDRATGTSFLIHNADKSFGFVSQDNVSNTTSTLDSRTEIQTPKKLDPSAPVFVPASAKLGAAVHDKQGGVDHLVDFNTNAHSTAALSSLSGGLLNHVKEEMSSAAVSSSFGHQYYNGAREPGTSGSLNPWLGAEVGISENVNLKSPNDKLHGRHRDSNASDTALVRSKSSVYAQPYSSGIGMTQTEHVSPSKLHGRAHLISSVADQSTKLGDHFVSVKQLVVEPKTLSMKGNKDIDHFLSFHISEDSAGPSSGNMKALSNLSPRHGCPSSLSSPEMDVKKLLTTMHGLSESLTHIKGVQGHSCGSDLQNEQEVILINCIVQNLNLYMRSRIEGHAGNSSNVRHGSYDPKQFANVHELSIRDLRPPGASNMTVNLDPKRKEKYSAVSGEIVPHSHLRESSVARGNGSAQVTANSAFQQNHTTEEQTNPQALFYRSLWLKAEADRCLIEYEASLSRMKL
ncbi:PREDICTED: uncharacterized protein LOC104815458 isoform X2 [Tarenaya hassleriana]|uniref:uncharacterized protein LOC104815458 isoform X2 n=1 Tax=Tarenaya hassleriana TaxID=28532 RepID=UPI00053C26C1|nr:PREDICTED: uncharacterized protein LOC104815458 isoform X2 [Tarenaya hassleriana]